MSDDGAQLKSIKVSPEVHEELAARKHGQESFDKVLKRTLGLVPRTVEQLTAMLPEQLATATTVIVTEHVTTNGRYRRIGHREQNKLTLEFVSKESNKGIFEISIYLPKADRQKHRVDIRYRNPQNELEKIAKLRDTQSKEVDIEEYTHFDTREVTGNSRSGEDAGQNAADEVVGPDVAQFVDQAYDVWGTADPQ